MTKICFFTSIGDNLSVIERIKKDYPKYDIICNYYGENNSTYLKISKLSNLCIKNNLSKFQSLKLIYKNIVDKYDYVFVYDDDACIVKGNLNVLINIATKYNLDIVSSSHDPRGKISFQNDIKNHIQIHKPQNGNHIFRYTNFIEMNFPVFSNTALKKYMSVYDGVLCGWGNDWWYCNVLESDIKDIMGIVDSVIIYNPINSDKINTLMNIKDRENQWNVYKKIYGLDEWLVKTKSYVYT
jgi:hypothetical protein